MGRTLSTDSQLRYPAACWLVCHVRKGVMHRSLQIPVLNIKTIPLRVQYVIGGGAERSVCVLDGQTYVFQSICRCACSESLPLRLSVATCNRSLHPIDPFSKPRS